LIKRIIFTILICVGCSKTTDPRPSLAICAIFKNEAPWLKEWVSYHHLVLGVDTFYLYNNESTDNYSEVLEPFIKDGIVQLIDWDSKTPEHLAYGEFMDVPWSAAQLGAYNDCLKRALGKVDWVGMIDIDEFIVPAKGIGTFYSLLNQAKEDHKGCLSIHWRVFGTSDVKDIAPNDLLIEKLTKCTMQSHPLNQHVKSLYRPEAVAFALVHSASKMNPGFGSRTLGTEQALINHYWTRTEDFCLQKRKISRETNPDLFQQTSATEDPTILQYLPMLR
jgi:hypothetical protein